MQNDIRILVVDDEPKICRMIVALLSRGGYAVDTCLDGTEALEKFRAARFDLVISDLRMPGVNGFDLIRQLKALQPDLPVIAVTGHATTDTAVHALQSGADDYIPKPFNIEKVRETVAAVLQSREVLAAAGAAAQTEAAATRPATTGAKELIEVNSRLEHRVAELLSVQETARAIAGELRLDAMAETVMDGVAALTGARSAAFSLVDPTGGGLVVEGCRGGQLTRTTGERYAIGEGLLGWVAHHRVPLLVSAIEDQPVFREAARAEGCESGTFLGVPLLHQDELRGVVGVADKEGGGAFDEHDMRLLVCLAPHVAIAAENARAYGRLQESAFAALCAMADSLEVRETYLRGHSKRVADYAARTASVLGLAPGAIRTLRQGARLLDIGALTLSGGALGRPGPLTDAEREGLKQHPRRGESMVAALGFLDGVLPLIRSHHERWDGQGYPEGLSGPQIDPLARILAMADAYDAMLSPRPHRQARTPEEALDELSREAGAQFDPTLLESFREAVDGMA